MSNPPSDYYVDPSIAADSGTGTTGDPYGDLQYALNQVGTSPGRNATNGDRFNVKAGTDEVLTAALSLATYGTPAYTGPLIFQGYTSSQGDGGMGGIDCNGNTAITNAGSGICWYDMHAHNGPSADAILLVGKWGAVVNCEVNNSNGHGIATNGNGGTIAGCNVYDVGDSTHDGIHVLAGNGEIKRIFNNYIKQGASRTMRSAIYVNDEETTVCSNIISIDGASDGIYAAGANAWNLCIDGNTIVSSAGTGQGIDLSAHGNNLLGLILTNNYAEGFSGTGGVGINATQDSNGGGPYGMNAVYNNVTQIVFNAETFKRLLAGGSEDNETLTASGLAKSGSDTFANRFTYFAPADEGNMQAGGFPQAA